MLAVQVAIPIVFEVLHHLLGGSLDPARGPGLRPLVTAQDAEIASLGFDDATSIVIGERVLGVLRTGFRAVGVAIAEGPRVGADGAAAGEDPERFSDREGGRGQNEWRGEGGGPAATEGIHISSLGVQPRKTKPAPPWDCWEDGSESSCGA